MAARGPLDRRRFLQLSGLAAGALATRGLDHWLTRDLGALDFDAAARALVESLSPVQRRRMMLPWDHPSRGLVTHVACMSDAPRVADTLAAGQQRLVHRLYETMTSAEKRDRFGRLIGLEAGGLDPCAILIYGEPGDADFQVALSGGHLYLRGGGKTRAGSAFGGPLGYGHQVGDGVPRLPGNAFAFHGDALNAFLASLPEDTRQAAFVAGPPIHETAVQLQKAGGRFRGLPANRLDERGLSGLGELIDVVLSCYDADEREAAWRCLRGNGDLAALHLAVYEQGGRYDDGEPVAGMAPDERARRGEPYWHVWRVEGPGVVLHFRGWPHVHASIHVADDGGARQHVGEVLGRTNALLEDAALRPVLGEALTQATGLSYAFVPEVPARFVPGPITTSLVWNLDPFDAEVGVMVIRGDAMGAPVRAALQAQGARVLDGTRYHVAMPSTFADAPEVFGEPERVEPSGLRTRGVYESYFRAGLARLA